MATRIEKTDLARDALYDKVNTMIDEVNTKIDNKDSLPSQTGNAGKFLTTDGTNASWGEVKQIEIKQDLTSPSADTVPSTKAVSDESSRITTLMNTKVSNCITEIPQDIKLELNNGTLTLKAGSKVYVPNGIYPATGKGKFELDSIDSDITTTGLNDGQIMILAQCSSLNSTSITSLGDALVTNTYTYSNTGSSTNGMVYLNTSNFIYFYENGTRIYRFGLPLAICTRTNGKITSIDQVFNGFVYIGSTVFALPGVKGLIPNSRNADGSLKSIEFVNDRVKTFTASGSGYGLTYFLTPDSVENLAVVNSIAYVEKDTRLTTFDNNIGVWFDTKQNIMLRTNDSGKTWTRVNYLSFSYMFMTNVDHLDYLVSKTVFHALDYNDKSTISGWSMPSNRYINLTLGASDSTYTAPANGYFYLVKVAGNDSGYINFLNVTKNLSQEYRNKISKNWLFALMPAQKGDVFKIKYTATGDTKNFRFIYAEGNRIIQ